MAEGVIPLYTVDVGADQPAPLGGGHKSFLGGGHKSFLGGCHKDPVASALIVAILVLLVILVVAVWRWMYRSKPNCGQYRGDARGACAQLSGACEGDPRCLNAVAHCMPVLDAAVSGRGLASSGQLRACSRAIRNVSPRLVAQRLAERKVCLPAEFAPAVHNNHGYREARAAARAAAPLIPYALEVAHALPACRR